MLAFCFTFTVSVYSSHSPIPCRISLVQVGLWPCNVAGRASPPPQPPSLRPPSSIAGAAARRRIELFGPGAPPPRQSLRVSSCVRAAGAAAACRRWRLIPWTLEPVVGRPWWRLSDRPCLSATFTRAAIQPADREQSSRRRQHWRRCPGDAEAWGGLLLLKIASAGLCESFGRRLLWSTSISPHSHQLGFRRGLGEGFHGGAPMARRAPTCVA